MTPPAPSRTRLRLAFVALALALAAVAIGTVGTRTWAAPPERFDPNGPWVRLVVLHTNDVHGGVLSRPASLAGLDAKGDVGGVASLAAFVGRERAAAKEAGAHVLLLDAGDVWRGTPEGDLTRGDLPVEALGRLHYDAVAVGNHDFDYGVDNLARLIRAAPFPWISASIVEEATGKAPAWVKPSVVVDVAGLRVGIIGLSPSDTAKLVAKDGTKGMRFLPEAEAASAAALALDPKADVLIFLAHLGPDRCLKVADAVPRVPLIVAGHDHRRLWKPVLAGPDHRSWIVEAGTGCVLAGRVRLRIHRTTREAVLEDDELVPLTPDRVGSDAETAAFLKGRLDAISELKALDAPIGRLAGALTRKGDGTTSPAGNLVTDAMRAAAGADVALGNRSGLRISLPAGPVSGRDLYLFSPFENTLVLVSLTGAELLLALGASIHGSAVTPLEVSGLTARYRIEGRGRAAKTVISSAEVAGVALDPAKTYRVVVLSFLAEGGGGYPMLRKPDATDTGRYVREAIRAWFEAHPSYAPDESPRIRPE